MKLEQRTGINTSGREPFGYSYPLHCGRDGQTRTADLTPPRRALYQAELHPDGPRLKSGAVGTSYTRLGVYSEERAVTTIRPYMTLLVGIRGFEPLTSPSRTVRSTKLSYTPRFPPY